MKVSKLIEILSKYDGNKEVWIYYKGEIVPISNIDESVISVYVNGEDYDD